VAEDVEDQGFHDELCILELLRPEMELKEMGGDFHPVGHPGYS
jgi:hypothetical protein